LEMGKRFRRAPTNRIMSSEARSIIPESTTREKVGKKKTGLPKWGKKNWANTMRSRRWPPQDIRKKRGRLRMGENR